MVGIVVGTLSGFFGIGGGTVLVPILLFMGYEMKTAIGISITQMVFSSVYGSYLNFRNGSLKFDKVLSIGLGGFFGAFLSGWLLNILSPNILEYLFLSFVIIALLRMSYIPTKHKHNKEYNPLLLFSIGALIGVFATSIGVGGSLLLVPILVGFFHFELKKAVSAGLFFVIFASMSGFISMSINGHIKYSEGFLIGTASLLGVYFGIKLGSKLSSKLQKRLLLVFYICVLTYLSIRIFS